jgi:hypothetical protein
MHDEAARRRTADGTGRDRRDFLKLAGLGAVTASAGAVAGAAPADAAAKPAPPDRGYRETEHVRKVYELARF